MSSSHNNASTSNASSSTEAAEITAGAKRLASELQEYMTEALGADAVLEVPQTQQTSRLNFLGFGGSKNNNEAVMELQIATCRKLREVS